MDGNGFKRCICRDENGRELGAKCPKLRRRGGSWNPHHGSWYGKAELPPGPDGKRIYLRLGGFASEGDLNDYYEQAGRLLDIPDAGPEGHEARMEILAMIKAAHRKKAPLPGFEDLHRKYRAGQPLQSMTFGEYWAMWVARRQRLKDIRKSTLVSYVSHHDVHFGPVLDGIRLDRLYAPAVEAVFTRVDERNDALAASQASEDPLVRASVRGQRPTGPVTKQRILATIRTVLSSAQREHLVSFNAAKLVKLDAGQKAKGVVWTRARVEAFNEVFQRRLAEERAAPVQPKKALEAFRVWLATPRPSPVMVWTPVQLGQFLDYAAADRLYALYHLIAFRGLRRGEACGLRWVDLDMDDGVLAVSTQLTMVEQAVEEGAPKTESSDGVIALDGGTVAALRMHRKLQVAERLKWGPAWVESGRIFTSENGAVLKPDWVSEHFERMAYAVGLPPIRIHDLRHGAATLSLAAGVDMKTTSAMLRHSSQAITSDTYTSVLPAVARAAAEASAGLVPRAVRVDESATGGPISVSLRRSTHPQHSAGSRKSQVET